MCGGGGPPPAPEPVDPLREAEAQIQIERERAAIEAQVRAEALERERVQREQDEGDFLRNLDAAFEGALLGGTSIIEDRGLDFADFESSFTTELDRIRRAVPFLDPNPGLFFGGNTADVILDRARDTQRRGFTNELNTFASPGFARDLFPDTADDATLAAILDEQFGTATDSVLRAFQRGNLTDQGFRSATERVGSQREAGSARLQDLGSGVLSGFRTQLRDIAEGGFTRAGAFELGGFFDPEDIRSRITSTTSDLQGRLGGDIRNVLGGEELFNIEDIITRAGISQGAQNPTAGLFDIFATRERERAKQRGLGSQGVF